MVWVYLHSNLCGGLQKTHLFCSRVLAENGFWSQIATLVILGHSFCNRFRPTRGSISPYIIAILITEYSQEVATQIAKYLRRRQHHSHLTPPPTGPPANIPIRLVFPETRIIGLHFCRWYGSIFIQIRAVGSKRRIFSATECVLAVWGHSRSSEVDDFGTNRKRVCDFLLVSHCDYGCILHRLCCDYRL